jgi:hypothetical protein
MALAAGQMPRAAPQTDGSKAPGVEAAITLRLAFTACDVRKVVPCAQPMRIAERSQQMIEVQIAERVTCSMSMLRSAGKDEAREQVIAVVYEAEITVRAGGDRGVGAPALDAPIVAQLRKGHGNGTGIAVRCDFGAEMNSASVWRSCGAFRET